MKLFKTNQKVYVLCFGLLALSGCWPFSEKKDSSSDSFSSTSSETSLADGVLMTIDGNVVLTVEEYENIVQAARQSNQQFANAIDSMPNAEKDFVFKGISSGKLMKSWAEKNGVDQTDEFIAERKQAHDSIDLQLYMKFYDEAHPVHISDKELKAFYEENKSSFSQLVISPGGVQCNFVRFETKDDAQDFLDAVKGKSAKTFAKEAEDRYAKVQDALINKSSQYSQPIKKFAEKVKKTPHTEIVKVSDNAYWVMLALSKEKAEYRALESPGVKEGIRSGMINKKKEEELEENMDVLRKEMNVVENHDYFVKKHERKRQEQEEAMKAQDAQYRMNHGKMEQGLKQEEEMRDNISKI
jgi:hypothetical protein